jgi:excisionase family DNA binding protein
VAVEVVDLVGAVVDADGDFTAFVVHGQYDRVVGDRALLFHERDAHDHAAVRPVRAAARRSVALAGWKPSRPEFVLVLVAGGSAAVSTVRCVLTVAEAAERVGRTPETVRRWIRSGRLPAVTERGHLAIAPTDLEIVRGELYPMLDLPDEWKRFEDGTPVPNWVAAVALGRPGR